MAAFCSQVNDRHDTCSVILFNALLQGYKTHFTSWAGPQKLSGSVKTLKDY